MQDWQLSCDFLLFLCVCVVAACIHANQVFAATSIEFIVFKEVLMCVNVALTDKDS